MMFGFIPPPSLNVIEIGPVDIHVYGWLIAIGVISAAILTRRRFAKRGGDPELADKVVIWAVVAGIVGARAAYVATHFGSFSDDRKSMFYVWEGGLAFYGGLVAGALAAILTLRKNKADIVAFAESVAPAIPLAQAIGRWGNYFNQELFGTPSSLPWALKVEAPERPAKYFEYSTFHPTFLYESIFNFALVAFIIWIDRKKSLKRGSLIFVYLAGYGLARFLLELIRTDTTFRLFDISRNGYVSLLAFAIGIAGIWWIKRRDAFKEPDVSSTKEPEASPATP